MCPARDVPVLSNDTRYRHRVTVRDVNGPLTGYESEDGNDEFQWREPRSAFDCNKGMITFIAYPPPPPHYLPTTLSQLSVRGR
ncbi:hypothetical protein RUM43_005785 [Polyplax serrata]|uniref:Uncharacterized protein n=1 Tax=Polyplax serrata TaxID=468196 RepID=A0AAN8NQU5_POLSC